MALEADRSSIVILIPDPEEMMFVTGDQERNLERVERAFGVKLVARGAELRISGNAAQVARASDVVAAMRAISTASSTVRAPSSISGMMCEWMSITAKA